LIPLAVSHDASSNVSTQSCPNALAPSIAVASCFPQVVHTLPYFSTSVHVASISPSSLHVCAPVAGITTSLTVSLHTEQTLVPFPALPQVGSLPLLAVVTYL
jgi:hypothetical protein